jgi:hypothetical protein
MFVGKTWQVRNDYFLVGQAPRKYANERLHEKRQKSILALLVNSFGT